MQKFEDSFDGAYYSSGKKNPQAQQTNGKKTKIIINVAGIILGFMLRDTVPDRQARRQKIKVEFDYRAHF